MSNGDLRSYKETEIEDRLMPIILDSEENIENKIIEYELKYIEDIILLTPLQKEAIEYILSNVFLTGIVYQNLRLKQKQYHYK